VASSAVAAVTSTNIARSGAIQVGWLTLQARIDFEGHVYTDNNGVSADLVLVWIHLQRRIR
jgi:hypothetical protein